MNLPAHLLSELAGLAQVIEKLLCLSEAHQVASEQAYQHTHHKLDQWIQTNHSLTHSNQALLKLITTNSEALTQLTTSYNNSVTSWQDLKPQPMLSAETINGFSDGLIQRLLPRLQQEIRSQENQNLAQLQPLLQQLLTQMSQMNGSLTPSLHQPSLQAESNRHGTPGSSRSRIPASLTIRERLNLSVEWVRQATVPLAILGGLLLMAGSGVGYAYAQVRQPLYVVGNTSPLTLEEAELLAWARSGEGRFARNLLDWNSGGLDSLHCTQDVERLGVTLEVQGRPADYGFCTLWVVPPKQRRFLEAS